MDERERERLRRLAEERGLDPEAVLAALGADGSLPGDLEDMLAALAARLEGRDGAD
ncbi:hypothetical protein M7784_05775 [Desulfovibrio aminophilus]|nr:hypothetical protein [Desulfovibrio aminophilus]MCM0754753.1 hypothetical protein [Desulfovibrio aminophilus]